MHVHVVIRSLKDDRIVPRMARILVELNKWSVSSRPRADVDINYFVAYFEWLYHKSFIATKTAVLMTHLEEAPAGNAKVKAFIDSARAASIRVAFCNKYAKAVEHFGPTFTARVPLDRNHFALTTRQYQKGQLPVVGVSGFTYKTDRKGQDLVARLAKNRLAKLMTLRASGRGWPIKTERYPWETLPTFFQSLDVLLCPSRVEGGPLPVLEAMSCGIPCVIPRDVGFLDELPNLPDLYRYKKGNFEGMCRAIEKALVATRKRKPDRAGLRSAVGCYSPKAWAKDHLTGFKKALSPAEQPVVLTMATLKPPEPEPEVVAPAPTPTPIGELPELNKGNCGIYIVAFGAPARAAAEICIKGIRKFLKGVPIALCSSAPLGGETVLIKQPDKDIGGRSPKVRAYDLAPQEWQYVFYLDADTEVVSPDVRFYFDLLQSGWEFVVATDPHLKDVLRSYKRSQGQQDYFDTLSITATDQALMYNGGVWAFRRCDRVRQFFDRWFMEWDKYGAKDQGALVRAMYADPLRIFVLGNEWNYFPKHARPGQTSAGIVHYPGRARRWKGQVPGRLDTREAWAMVRKEAARKRVRGCKG